MRYSNRLFLYGPLFVLLALAVAAGLRWRLVAGELESWLRQHNGHEIAPGVTVHFASESVAGFPFNVDAVLGDVSFHVKSARASGSWHTDGFAIHELTYGRAQQIYEAAGTQTIAWTDAEGGAHRFVFVPGSLRASAILSHGALLRFDLDINGIGSREVSGARVQLHFRKAHGRDAIDLVASADELRLAPALQAGFGADLRRVDVEGYFTSSASFVALFEGRETWDSALDAWRLSGGTFHLGNLEIAWDGLQASAKGRLALDVGHRLQGTLDLSIENAAKAPAGRTTDARLARALTELTKVTNAMPYNLSANILAGAVNLRVTNPLQIMESAGTVGPLY
jgi:hypothetical protein